MLLEIPGIASGGSFNFPFFYYVYAMKLLFLFLFIPFFAFSQATEVTLKDYKVRGYIQGVRLDSVSATYGQAALPDMRPVSNMDVMREYIFDIGTMYKNNKDIRITTQEGKPLQFSGTAGLLNFMDFNGWEVVQVYYQPTYSILFRKKGTK